MGTKKEINRKDTEKFKDIEMNTAGQTSGSWNIIFSNIDPIHIAELEIKIKDSIAESKDLQRTLKVEPVMGDNMKWTLSVKEIPDAQLETFEIKFLRMLGRKKKKVE